MSFQRRLESSLLFHGVKRERMTQHIINLEGTMRAVHLRTWGLIVILFLAVWNVGQAQDSLGMHHVATLDYWQGANDIQMIGDLAYVVSGTSGLHIMDLTDPTDPQEIGRGSWYDWEDATGGIYITNNRAYVANDCGCSAFDISDPTNPIQLARWWEDRIQYDIFVHDTIAIIQGEDMQVIADISDLENVQQIGDFGYRMMWPLGMADEYLCMASSEGGLLMFDISDPSQPVEAAQVDTTMTGGLGTIVGDYAYFGTFNNGVRIIDVSNPLQPLEVAYCDSGWCCNLTVTNSYLAISKGLTLSMWNVADPAHPYQECVFPTPPGITIVSGKSCHTSSSQLLWTGRFPWTNRNRWCYWLSFWRFLPWFRRSGIMYYRSYKSSQSRIPWYYSQCWGSSFTGNLSLLFAYLSWSCGLRCEQPGRARVSALLPWFQPERNRN
jgi:hypothetical protein